MEDKNQQYFNGLSYDELNDLYYELTGLVLGDLSPKSKYWELTERPDDFSSRQCVRSQIIADIMMKNGLLKDAQSFNEMSISDIVESNRE